MRKIGVIIGSESDLPQCRQGLDYLLAAEKGRKVELLRHCTESVHRNTLSVLGDVSEYVNQGVDVLIVGAGMANHLTGTVERFLRNTLRDTHVVVVGVAFESKNDPGSQAAILSITKVPGIQVVFQDFVGEKGFLEACKYAVNGELVNGELPSIQLKPNKPVVRRTIKEAREEALIRITRRDLAKAGVETEIRKLAEGKTKIIWEILNAPEEVFIESKDSITAGNGVKHDIIEGKGAIATTTTCNCFRLLNFKCFDIDTHFISPVTDRIFQAHRAEMIPIEVVIRRIATGSYLQRHPDVKEGTRFTVKEGTRFTPVEIEFFLKDDARHDPLMIWDEAGGRFKLYNAHEPLHNEPFDTIFGTEKNRIPNSINEVEAMRSVARDVFLVLEKAWEKQDVVLVDLKVEFGREYDSGILLVADVIDNDSWRIWPKGDKSQMKDKQTYRNLKKITPEAIVAVRQNYEWVAKATEKFLK